MTKIEIGSLAPDFNFKMPDGTETSLAKTTQQKEVILYFYPRDFTLGCTKEACDFRDSWVAIQKADALVIGISTDSDPSHKKFQEKLKLPFPLVPDESKKIVNAYGVFGEKKFLGKTFQGTRRTTLLIGRDRKIKKIFQNVRVNGHVREVLEALKNSE